LHKIEQLRVTSDRLFEGVSPAAIIVSGIPGAGKTTVARLLARRFERAAHIEADEVQRMVVAGGVWPDGDGLDQDGNPQGEALRQLELRARNVCLLANSFGEAGVVAIIDDVVIGTRLEAFRSMLTGRPLWFVLLVPNLERVAERNATRGSDAVFERWRHLDATTREETERVGLWLDSSELSAEETVARILEDGGASARFA
jgi:chloramphenicol 3-O-phosphotransferase